MKKLNVVQRGRDWVVTGLRSGPLEIHRRIPYPESEWPEIGEIQGYKEMHQALYDLWQTSDELGEEDKRSGGTGLLFHTPFGDFATYSYEVIPAEDSARIANEMRKEEENASAAMQKEIMAEKGFGEKHVEEIIERYGSRFDDWPKDLVREYWQAYDKAERETRDYFKRCKVK